MTVDLLIIHPRTMWFSSKSFIANGPLTVASYIHKRGFRVKVIDDNTSYRKYDIDDFSDYINSHQVKIIGFSVSTLNAYNSYLLVRELRKRFPEKIFIGGGIHSYDAWEEMSEQGFDVVFKGEAELSLERFMRGMIEYSQGITRGMLGDNMLISRFKEIHGITIKLDGEIIDTGFGEIIQDLDKIPFNNFDLINLDDYIASGYDHHGVTNQINCQRGCFNNCTFCKSCVTTSRIRNNSAEYMIKQLEDRYERYKVKNVFFTDSNFTFDKARIKEFCSLMVSSGLSRKINIMIQSSVNIPLDDHDIKMISDSGITMFFIGVERFDDDAREKIRKAGTCSQISSLIKRLQTHGIKPIVNILVNFPFETEETLDREAKLIERHLPYVDFVYINYLSPMPGTQIYKEDSNGYFAKWYLRKGVANYRMSYYDLAYLIEGPLSLKLNVFRLHCNVLTKMRRFKEKYQFRGSLRIANSPFLRAVIIADMLLGKLSYYIAKLSPLLEDLIFRPFKFFRLKGYKMFFRLFIAKHR